MCGEIERGVELVDRFILIQIDDIFDERFVEMVFYFIDDKVESVFKRKEVILWLCRSIKSGRVPYSKQSFCPRQEKVRNCVRRAS